MMSTAAAQSLPPYAFPSKLIGGVADRLSANKRVRRTLPVWGRIHIDRQIPFLCIYRRPTKGNHEGTERLVTSEASYLTCSGQKRLHGDLAELIRTVAQILVEQFGACLLLEMWEAPASAENVPTTAKPRPQFRIVTTKAAGRDGVTDGLESALSRVQVGGKKARVSVVPSKKSCPKAMPPFLSTSAAAAMGCLLYGLEISPIYRNGESGEVFPLVLRRLRRSLSIALRRAFFDFVHKHTTHRPPHFHSLGRRAVVKAVWEVDKLLAEASEQFDFLLQITPVNVEQAWRKFKRGGCETPPSFHYRPLPAEPVTLKRNLYKAPVERVEDPALARIFREKMAEVDRQITMLQERNTSGFLHESIQLFGGVEDTLWEEATRILDRIPPRSRERETGGSLGAKDIARLACWEIDNLRQQDPSVSSVVQVRPDVTGVMVSRGNVLISDLLRIPASRVNALLQHEVGTHVLTFHNGYSQPFRQLHAGLAGYDSLQEGLAVLSEYLVGGLTRPRLRLLAARVAAVRLLCEGASFMDTYRELAVSYGFGARAAFMITMRVYRGGGLTKDAAYLRGLCRILEYLGQGGELQPLFVGKIALEHIPIIRELMWRGVLTKPPLIPRYLNQPEAEKKLDRVRHGMSVLDLTRRKQ